MHNLESRHFIRTQELVSRPRIFTDVTVDTSLAAFIYAQLPEEARLSCGSTWSAPLNSKPFSLAVERGACTRPGSWKSLYDGRNVGLAIGSFEINVIAQELDGRKLAKLTTCFASRGRNTRRSLSWV